MLQAKLAGKIAIFLFFGLLVYQFKNVAPFLASIFGASDPNGAWATGVTILAFFVIAVSVGRFIRRI